MPELENEPEVEETAVEKPAPQMTSSMRREFEEAAQGVARQYSLDVVDLKDAYESKPESLSVLFESMSEAKRERNEYVGWSVFWAIVFWPVAGYTGYKAYENHMIVNDVKEQVKSEVESHKQEKGQPSVEAPSPK